jgi:hypothetical protein
MKLKKRPRRLPRYTSLGCPLTRNRSNWCFRLCRPEGQIGLCGRHAPHRMRSRIQTAIARHQARKRAAELL